VRDAVIRDSTADRGGAAMFEACEASFTRVSITGNTAAVAGGINTSIGRTRLANVTITGNTASIGGGLTSSGSAARVDLTASTITHNSSSNAHGGGIYIEGVASCTTSTIAANTGNGVYLVGQNAGYSSTLCDYGDGAQTNTPNDVVPANSATTNNFGAAATFSCSNTACI
jgi:hypothetical protein